MAVPEGERRPCKMDVFMHELDLVTYTLQITRNEKIFLPEYKGCVTDDIVETAKNGMQTISEYRNVAIATGRRGAVYS